MGIYPRVPGDKYGVRSKDVIWIIAKRTARKIPGWTIADTTTEDKSLAGYRRPQERSIFHPGAQTRGIMRIGFHAYDRTGDYNKQRVIQAYDISFCAAVFKLGKRNSLLLGEF